MNLLAHGLLALAMQSGMWFLATGEPLNEYAFLAAFVALLPDVGRGERGESSPISHSAGYALLWSLLSLSALGFASASGVIPPSTILPLQAAVMIGLGSHLLLDWFVEPGIFGVPIEGRWPRVCLGIGRTRLGRVNLVVSSASTTLLLVLAALG